MMTGWDFLMKGQDFHDDRSRFSWLQVEVSWWQVKILLWTVNIFMTTSRDFIINGRGLHDYRPRFSWWQVEIFMVAGRYFVMNGQYFHADIYLLRLNSGAQGKFLTIQFCSFHPANGILFRAFSVLRGVRRLYSTIARFTVRHFCGRVLYGKITAWMNGDTESLLLFGWSPACVRTLWPQGSCV